MFKKNKKPTNLDDLAVIIHHGFTETQKAFDKRFNDLGQKMATKKELGGLDEKVGNLKEELSGVKEGLGGLKEEVGGIKEGLGNVKESVKIMAEELNATHSDVRYIRRSVDMLVRNDAAMKDPITRVRRLEQKTGLVQ